MHVRVKERDTEREEGNAEEKNRAPISDNFVRSFPHRCASSHFATELLRLIYITLRNDHIRR